MRSARLLLLSALLLSLLSVCFSMLQDPKASPIQQVHISIGKDPDTMLVIWVTQSKTNPIVFYGTSPSPPFPHSTSGTSATYSYQSYTSPFINTVILTSLLPSTRYYYQVGTTSAFTSSFVTPPPVGASTPITFVGVGDVGTDSNSQSTINGMIAASPGLVFHVGDLSYANGNQPVWDTYGTMLQPLAQSIPYQPVVGNHEDQNVGHTFAPYSTRYNLPDLEKYSNGGTFYYSFNYGMLHFISLSSENDYARSSPQYAWLQKDLQSINRTATPWVVAGWHRPWYNSNRAHHLEGEAMRVSMEDLLNTYRVDIVLAGHVHAYERCNEIYNYVVTAGAPYYLTVGMGGSPEGLATGWYTQPDWSVVRYANDWGYLVMHVQNATHTRGAMHTNSNGVVDDFWIIRSR